MLSVLSSSLSVSTAITQTTLPLLAKETHEPAIIVLAAALPPHLLCMLQNDKPIPSDVVSLIAKEMNNTKPTMRRAFCSLTGNVIWKLEDVASGASLAFAKAVFPALENNLKTASNNPLNSTSGSLDGYIAVATLLGPLTRSKAFSAFLDRPRSNANTLTSIQMMQFRATLPFSRSPPRQRSLRSYSGTRSTKRSPMPRNSCGSSARARRR